MGIFTDIIDDMKDRGQYDGMNTGWSSISPRIKYSSKQKEILSSIGLATPNTIKDIGNIVFLKSSETVQNKRGKIELILSWKYIIEKRKNKLMFLQRKMRFKGSQISIDSSLDELDLAYKSILQILSEEPDMSVTKCKYQETDDEFLQVFCQELLNRLLNYIKNIEDGEIIKSIIFDMKYLTAVVLNVFNEDEEYECSTYAYIMYLKKLGLKYKNMDCKNCSIEILFDEYKYCLACGKRK